MTSWYRGHRIEINKGVRVFEFEIFDPSSRQCAVGFQMLTTTTVEALTARLKAKVDELCKPIIWATESAKAVDKVQFFDNKGRLRTKHKKKPVQTLEPVVEFF
jgi:hypothetical protein